MKLMKGLWLKKKEVQCKGSGSKKHMPRMVNFSRFGFIFLCFHNCLILSILLSLVMLDCFLHSGYAGWQ